MTRLRHRFSSMTGCIRRPSCTAGRSQWSTPNRSPRITPDTEASKITVDRSLLCPPATEVAFGESAHPAILLAEAVWVARSDKNRTVVE